MSDKDPYGQNVYGTQPAGAAPAPEGMPPLATLGQRVLARLIDTALLVVLGLVFAVVIYGGHWNDPQGVGFAKQLLAGVLTYAIYFVYEGFMLSRSGQTLGKSALRIRVARLADGSVPGNAGWLRAAVYSLPGILSSACVGVLFWLLNVLWCTWDKPYQQCLHDKAAKTVVVRAG